MSKLNKTQAGVLRAVQECPGILFALGTRKARAAVQLKDRGLIKWVGPTRSMPGARTRGWYPIAKAERTE